jgi:phosphonate transport system permease protein
MRPDATLPSGAPRPRITRWQAVGVFALLGLLALPWADIAITAPSPAAIFSALGWGFLMPDFFAIERLPYAVGMTIAVAVAGVMLGALCGFILALFWHRRIIRTLSLGLRGVHELIWALLIMSITGPTAQTAVLALAIAYSGVFAKVFAEILEEGDARPRAALPGGGAGLSALIYAKIIPAFPAMWIYFAYRIECGLRSSAVLGFVGLPTLGFELDTLFKQGRYDGAAAVLLLTYALVLTLPFWLRRSTLVPLGLAAFIFIILQPGMSVSGYGLVQLFTVDLVPSPLRGADLSSIAPWQAFAGWLGMLLTTQILPGLAATIVLSILAVLLTGLIALLTFPLILREMAGRGGHWLGNALLIILRSTPEYMLVFIGVQALGPSMLPAILALGLHNGAIIAHLLGRNAQNVLDVLRVDRPRGLNLYAYELVPRLSAPFFAYVLYRMEIIVRESMILGLLGITTLGFYIDSAIAELRMDRALVLILAMIALSGLVDATSRRLRRAMGLAGITMVEKR